MDLGNSPLYVCVCVSDTLFILHTQVNPHTRDWHDCGIPAPNATVLIAIFAFRLSAVGGECHVWQVRRMGEEEEVEKG